MTYSAEQREAIIQRVVEGLTQGIPLAVLCRGDGMCGVSTFYEWVEKDEKLSGDIARARDFGFDAIAADCLAIADDSSQDTRVGQDGREIPDNEWISRSRLRVETRLKLLAKWDPRRYGELVKMSAADGVSDVVKALNVVFVRDAPAKAETSE